nr:hypothetical protein [Arthrospira sp. PLM2.Bin9]
MAIAVLWCVRRKLSGEDSESPLLTHHGDRCAVVRQAQIVR